MRKASAAATSPIVLKKTIARYYHQLERSRLRQAWLRQMHRQGVLIHKSIELTGRADVMPWLKFGAGSYVERECTIWCAAEPDSEPSLITDANVFVGRNTYLGVWKPIYIGTDTIIGAYCYIISGNHRFSAHNLPVRMQGYDGGPITIGRNVWLGAHVIVLPGVTIGDNAVVGAASVVTSSVPEAEIWAGVPARRIGAVFPNS
jgi:acetyltransferase-like isoleucine patch superfamily enzyme